MEIFLVLAAAAALFLGKGASAKNKPDSDNNFEFDEAVNPEGQQIPKGNKLIEIASKYGVIFKGSKANANSSPDQNTSLFKGSKAKSNSTNHGQTSTAINQLILWQKLTTSEQQMYVDRYNSLYGKSYNIHTFEELLKKTASR